MLKDLVVHLPQVNFTHNHLLKWLQNFHVTLGLLSIDELKHKIFLLVTVNCKGLGCFKISTHGRFLEPAPSHVLDDCIICQFNVVVLLQGRVSPFYLFKHLSDVLGIDILFQDLFAAHSSHECFDVFWANETVFIKVKKLKLLL